MLNVQTGEVLAGAKHLADRIDAIRGGFSGFLFEGTARSPLKTAITESADFADCRPVGKTGAPCEERVGAVLSDASFWGPVESQRLVCKKLLDIMDLQGDIDTLLRDVRRSPFGSEKFKNARPEELQRLVMMTAIQFVLFEPHDWVQGNDEFKLAAKKLLDLTSSQIHWLKAKYHKKGNSGK